MVSSNTPKEKQVGPEYLIYEELISDILFRDIFREVKKYCEHINAFNQYVLNISSEADDKNRLKIVMLQDSQSKTSEEEEWEKRYNEWPNKVYDKIKSRENFIKYFAEPQNFLVLVLKNNIANMFVFDDSLDDGNIELKYLSYFKIKMIIFILKYFCRSVKVEKTLKENVKDRIKQIETLCEAFDNCPLYNNENLLNAEGMEKILDDFIKGYKHGKK